MIPRSALAALGLVALAFALAFAHPPPTGGPRFRDFESYFAAGATWTFGGDPYSREIWRTERTIPEILATRDELLPFVGPPLGLPLWAALASLGWGRATALWYVAMSLAVGTLALVGFGLARVRVTFARAVGSFAFAAGFGPLTSGVALGQVAIFACAAVAVAALALRMRRGLGAALLAALAAALQPNLAVALLARVCDVRSALAIVGAATLAVAGSALALTRFGGLPHYLAVLSEHANAERFIAIQTTPTAIARAFGAEPAWANALGIALALAVLAVLGRQVVSRRYAPDERLLLACAGLPLAWPFAHEHDFALVFAPAIATAARARGRTWVLAAVAALLVSVDWLGLAQRPTGVTFATFAAICAALGLIALAAGPVRAAHATPLAIALAVMAAGALAAHHPLPVWPDALPLDFHASPALAAGEVWRAEQTRAGIATQDSVWGLLRLLSLLGCAGVWAAASFAFDGLGNARTLHGRGAGVGDTGHALPLGVDSGRQLIHARDERRDLPQL